MRFTALSSTTRTCASRSVSGGPSSRGAAATHTVSAAGAAIAATAPRAIAVEESRASDRSASRFASDVTSASSSFEARTSGLVR
jgi:hypothetical protein